MVPFYRNIQILISTSLELDDMSLQEHRQFFSPIVFILSYLCCFSSQSSDKTKQKTKKKKKKKEKKRKKEK